MFYIIIIKIKKTDPI